MSGAKISVALPGSPPRPVVREQVAGSTERLESVQVLRGVAAMLVVVAHGFAIAQLNRDTLGEAWMLRLGHLPDFGNIGVDLFFVISGFVMALSAARFSGAHGAMRFVVQRFLRVAPMFYLVALVLLANLWIGHGGLRGVSIFNTLAFVPWLDVGAYAPSVHPYGWTLSFEFVFYLLVAVPILLGMATRPGVLLAGLLVLATLGLVVTPPAWVPLRWLVNPILYEFALGVAAYMMWRAGWLDAGRPWRWLALGAALATAAWQIVHGYGEVARPEYVWDLSLSLERVLLWGLPSFLVMCFVVGAGLHRLPVGGGLLRLLGDASYSIYLVQVFAVLPINRAVRMGLVLPPDLLILVFVLVAAAAGVAGYLLAERPMNRVAQAWTKRAFSSAAHRRSSPRT